MFTLDADRMPQTTQELADVVGRSVRRWVDRAAVTIDGELPTVRSFDVDLTGGTVRTDARPDVATVGPTEPGPAAGAFRVRGRPVRAEGVAADFDLSATGVRFVVGRNAAGQIVVAPDAAADGRLVVSLTKPDLEAAVLKAARAGAAAGGVAVQKVEVTLASEGPRDVEFRLAVTAKKFVTTVVHIAGRVAVDDRMVARVTGLTADGDGMVGTMAVGFIRPQLKAVEGRPFPLLAVSLGTIRLRDVAVDVTDGLTVTAAFGG